MRNVYEVLREKELFLQRIAREIQILRLAAPLLAVDDETSSSPNTSFEDSERGSMTPPQFPADQVWPDQVRTDQVPSDHVPTDHIPADQIPTDHVPASEHPAGHSSNYGSADPESTSSTPPDQTSAWDRLARPWSKPRRPIAS